MKRITFWLLTVSLTFVLSLTATFTYLKFIYPDVQKSESRPEISLPEIENNPADLPILAFCELTKNPEKYDGKIVRLSAKMFIGTENSWFSDFACGVDNAAIISSKNKEVWKAIEKATEGKKKEHWAFKLDLIVTGRFENVSFKECYTIAPFQFEILTVEKASKID